MQPFYGLSSVTNSTNNGQSILRSSLLWTWAILPGVIDRIMSGFVMCLFTGLLVCRSAMSEDHLPTNILTEASCWASSGLGATNQKEFPPASTPFTALTRLYHLISLTQEYRGLPAACMQSVCTSSYNSSAELAAALFVTVAELSRTVGACSRILYY